jgi:membrane fusion protein, type I secretion system
VSSQTPKTSALDKSLRNNILAIGIASVVLVVGLGGWAATTEFSGAVIASGQLVVDSAVKKVQHPTGGVVGDLRVRDGNRVLAGDILVRLDDTQTRANLAIVTKGLDEMMARQAREEAERDGEAKVTFPEQLLSRMDDADVARAVNGERRQFETRRAAREGQKSQLKERVAQLGQEITGYTAQITSKVKQIEWITKELEGVNDLWRKNLVPYTRVTTLEREKERLDGEHGQLIATISQARGKIAETELQILQIDQDMRSEVGRDLADIRAKSAELVEKKVAAEDQLRRVDIRAPQSGMVHQMSIHTVGGVVGPGEQMMLIVPESDVLMIEGKVAPQDIDQLHIGQPAFIRLTAFNQRTTPELTGEVSLVSADVNEDQKTGARYYTVRIAVPESEVARLEGLKLVPGMPAEVFIQTTPRTVLSYFVRPLQDQLSRAFREK